MKTCGGSGDRSSRIFDLGAGWRRWSASLCLSALPWSKEPRQALKAVSTLWTTEKPKSLQGISSGFTECLVRNVITTLTELSRLIWIRLSYAVCANSSTGVEASMLHTAFFVEKEFVREIEMWCEMYGSCSGESRNYDGLACYAM